MAEEGGPLDSKSNALQSAVREMGGSMGSAYRRQRAVNRRWVAVTWRGRALADIGGLRPLRQALVCARGRVWQAMILLATATAPPTPPPHPHF